MRQKREFPFIDKKIITAWNAMMIEAKIEASFIDKKYLQEALRSLQKLLQTMMKKGKLYHQTLPGSQPKKAAMLEDYAYLIQALLSAYEYTLDKVYLQKAKALFVQAKGLFYKNGTWYLSSHSDVAAPANLDDSYYSSPLAVMYHDMLTLADLLYDLKLYSFVEESISRKSRLIQSDAHAFATATRAALRVALGDVIVKSQKPKLLRNLATILRIKYPYILIKNENVKNFEACTIRSCFASYATIEALVKRIEARLKREKKIGWRSYEKR